MSVRPEHTRGDTDANALAFALDFIGLDIGTKRSVEIANYARAALDRLVARNQQLQEALERIASGDINWQACKAEARAALASTGTPTP